MQLQNLREADWPKLFDLYCDLTGGGNYEKMCSVLREIKDNPHYTLFCVYDDDQTLIATASLTKCLDLTGDARYYYSMENFIVDKTCRRRGVGRFLLNAVEEYVKAHNGSYLSFTSSPFRKEAHLFYEKMGYRTDATQGFKKIIL